MKPPERTHLLPSSWGSGGQQSMAGASALALLRLPSRSEPHPQKRCSDDCVLFSVWVFICYAVVDDQYMGSELQKAHLCFYRS